MNNKTDKKRPGRPKNGDGYPVRIICRVPEQQARFISAMRKNHGLTRSAIIRKALDLYMRQTV